MAILTMLRHRFYKNDATPNAGGKVYTYEAGTSTPVTTYTSSAATTPNANPIILDAKGECDLWITGQIKVNVLQSDDVQVTGWPVDNVGSGVSNNDATSRWSGTAGGTANAITISPSPSITSYVVGQSFVFKAGAVSNSGATTIAVSGLSHIAAQSNGAACAGDEIQANKEYLAVLDSLTTFQISKIGRGDIAKEIHAATNKTTPIGADELGIWDSVTGLLNRVSFTNALNFFAAKAGSAAQAFATAALSISGLQTLAAGADIASSATVDLTAATGNFVRITGTTPTSAFTMSTGQQMSLIADGAWTLTYHATTNKISGGSDVTLSAGDIVICQKDLAGVVHSRIVRDANMVQTSATAANTGTTIVLPDAPNWARKITVKPYAVSTNGTSIVQLRIGPVGGVEVSGYAGYVSSAVTTASLVETLSSGIALDTASTVTASSARYGVINLERMDNTNHIWVFDGGVGAVAGGKTDVSGGITLATVLTKLSLTTVNGTDAFDGSGVVSVTFEG